MEKEERNKDKKNNNKKKNKKKKNDVSVRYFLIFSLFCLNTSDVHAALSWLRDTPTCNRKWA
ncbi:hypothetical protein EYF80_048836 [Liparis tanakae]|uniref:Uncharacterized protein n=1 Tax=Liparis tanakae TaxID=230148 RepID=A0A4Z2FJ99_9TELE|nr:hypothetical protein EYF80_048836 [Liparis tanakae]